MKFSLNPATVSALHLTWTYGVPPDRVRKAWTTAEALGAWWGPLKSAQWNAKVGEGFRLEGAASAAEPAPVVVGEFRDLSKEMWVLSWAREGKLATGGTLVTIEFRKVAKGTELALTHELLPNAQVREAQRIEWLDRLDRLAKSLQ